MPLESAIDRPQDRPVAAAGACPSVCLVGMMGVGKTTIGRQLALALEREFVDLDHVIESRCGVRIATIFDIEGEAGFRRRETAVLDEYTQHGGLVLATGGGAVLAAENRVFLRDRVCVVYLRASVEELYRRVSRDRNRPLLQAADPLERLTALVAGRAPLYEEVADITLDTGGQPISHIVRTLVPLLRPASPH